ncbi:ABC transporter permease [Oceanicella sp. SM1341]|uniref:ABC transporter permease n=1 Tax=Oceanicella sp. SM1341 TaxID=1548889 RepID=UPI000E47A21A|nr:ABC transporter permease [Oceanicella sp. SM1341]
MGTYRPGPVAILLAVLAGLFLLAPMLAVIPMSFTPFRYLKMPEGELSLRHYRTIWENADWHASIWLSVRVGLVASSIATFLATAFSLGMWYVQPRLKALLIGFVMLPMIVPPVVSAVILYFFMSWLAKAAPAIGYDTFWGVVISHVVMVVPFAVVVVMVALSQIDRRIEMAARGMGASIWQASAWVILPNIGFGLVAAWVMAFVLSWEEIAVTLFITSINAITLPRRIWMGLRDNVDPAVAAISVILIVITLAVVLGRILWRETRK